MTPPLLFGIHLILSSITLPVPFTSMIMYRYNGIAHFDDEEAQNPISFAIIIWASGSFEIRYFDLGELTGSMTQSLNGPSNGTSDDRYWLVGIRAPLFGPTSPASITLDDLLIMNLW
jgi:hypothetical protein